MNDDANWCEKRNALTENRLPRQRGEGASYTLARARACHCKGSPWLPSINRHHLHAAIGPVPAAGGCATSPVGYAPAGGPFR